MYQLNSSDRRYRIQINFIISIIILVGFLTVGLSTYAIYSNLIKEDVLNVSKLTASNIYGDIGNELTKPIFVSLTMANDNFLKTWIKEEATTPDIQKHREELQHYLFGIKAKYLYDSVFLVSDQSKVYYHYEGINKTISPDDKHDDWYFNYLSEDLVYDLDVDTDQANQNRLSVFINCRILDDERNLLGVTGVGLEIKYVQALLQSFETEFDLKAMLFSRDGSIQIDSTGDHEVTDNLFEASVFRENRDRIINNLTGFEVVEFQNAPYDGYFITRYIEDLDWYLMVKKDTSQLAASLNAQISRIALIYIIVTTFVLLFANRIITRHRLEMLALTKTDTPTGLMNRRGFNDRIRDLINNMKDATSTYIFVFDIDNFKNVNDKYGHLVGDNVLYMIGELATTFVGERGNISRWGGDEFAGFLHGESDEVKILLDQFFEELRIHGELSPYGITISLGIIKHHPTDSAESLLHRADQALYKAKDLGKNQYFLFEGLEIS